MKEDIRAIFRNWCRGEKLIIPLESENLLVDDLFDLLRQRLRELKTPPAK